MSSHHFVKEGQEPALFIYHALSLSLIQPLLEWAPLVLVTEAIADEVIDWGIKIDAVLITQNHSDSLALKLKEQAPITTIQLDSTKSDLLAGLEFLTETNQTAVNIVARPSDYVFALVETFKDNLNIVLITEQTRWSIIKTAFFEKWIAKDSILKIRKLKTDQPITLSGLVEIKHNVYRSVSDGLVTIKSDKGFWIGEQL